jgi:hypothetical protein
VIFPAESVLKAVIAVAAILLLAVGVVLPRVELKTERLAHEQTKRQHAEERARLLAAAREQEITMQRAVARAQGDLDEARRSIRLRDQALGRLRTDAGGLRERLAAYAAAGSRDPACAGDDRAGVLARLATEGAELLARGGTLLRACAADHDERAAEVRALLAAWPRPAVPSVAD